MQCNGCMGTLYGMQLAGADLLQFRVCLHVPELSLLLVVSGTCLSCRMCISGLVVLMSHVQGKVC